MFQGSSPRLRGTLVTGAFLTLALGIIPALAGNTWRGLARRFRTRDHPRACGEHSALKNAFPPCPGSSPRLRGTQRRGGLPAGPTGIIPALAGNTTGRPHRTSANWDHPRACGEHFAVVSHTRMSVGSSPRLRGTRVHEYRQAQGRGIIPALAGNTNRSRVTTDHGGDHPRACGEHQRHQPSLSAGRGSSPRLRGTRDRHRGVKIMTGIIPALAGNTRRLPMGGGGMREHPRACGEHIPAAECNVFAWGSSPRLRGTHRFNLFSTRPVGIIPALAGNTVRRSRIRIHVVDHPRACGEHSNALPISVAAPGSSPRLRGTHAGLRHPFHQRAIIPALAGNTLVVLFERALDLDHPRACGEHTAAGGALLWRQRSSPRLRGTHSMSSCTESSCLIIPALAGNTR